MKRAVFVALVLLVSCFMLHATVLAGLNDGLVAYWPFNGNANDESGNGNHGTVSGATLCVDQSSSPDKAYCFDGVDDYISIGTNVKPPFPFTIVAWVKLNSFVGGTIFVNDLVNPAGQGYYGAMVTTGDNGFLVGWYGDGGYSGGGSRRGKFTVAPVLTVGKWAHIAIKFNTHLDMDLYVNAVKQNAAWDDGTGDTIQFSSNP